MWPQIIGSIATGLSGLVVAVAGLLAARSQGASSRLRSCEAELERERLQLVACLRHLARVERMLANTGTAVPSRPQALRSLVT